MSLCRFSFFPESASGPLCRCLNVDEIEGGVSVVVVIVVVIILVVVVLVAEVAEDVFDGACVA